MAENPKPIHHKENVRTVSLVTAAAANLIFLTGTLLSSPVVSETLSQATGYHISNELFLGPIPMMPSLISLASFAIYEMHTIRDLFQDILSNADPDELKAKGISTLVDFSIVMSQLATGGIFLNATKQIQF